MVLHHLPVNGIEQLERHSWLGMAQHLAGGVTHEHQTGGVAKQSGLLFGQDDLCHVRLLRAYSTASASQCPIYFAYNVRALSTSLVPLMIARPSGNTVNSKP